MKKITKKQKVGLIILGIFLTLIILEMGLHLGGFILLSIQRSRNIISEDKDEYVILSLGESTTANLYFEESNWPIELEKVLNKKSSVKKFEVINEGVVGITTTEILANLGENLKRYKPDIVITMMGINDALAQVGYDNSFKTKLKLFLDDIKIYKLGKLLFLHWSEKIKNFYEKYIDSKKENSSRSCQGYIELGWEYGGQEKYKEAEEAFKKAIEIDPKNHVAYIGLGYSYRSRLNVEKAEEAFKKAIEINPGSYEAYEGLAWVYNEKGKPKLAGLMLKKAIEIYPNNSMTHVGLARLYKDQGKINETIETLKRAIEINPVNERVYLIILEEVFRNLSMKKEAEETYQKILEIRMRCHNLISVRNYQELYKILNERGIKLFVMQYPIRDIEEVKNCFSEEQQKNLIFISNEENFKEAVKNESYDKYFIDRFAGDFGHTTLKGNRLIAENVADAVLEELKLS